MTEHDYERLGRALTRDLGDGLEHADVNRQRAAFLGSLSPQRTVTARPLLLLAAATCAVLLVGFFGWRATPVTFEVNGVDGNEGQVVSAAADEVPIVFADGSTVHLAPASALAVEHTRHGEVTLRLTAGRLDAHVRHGTHVRWRFAASDVVVRVVGTRLSVTTSDGGARVGISEGAVLVTGASLPRDGVRVAAHQELARDSDGRYAVRDLAPVAASGIEAAALTPQAEPTRQPELAHAPSPRAGPRNDDHRPPPRPTPPPSEMSADALVAEADAARDAGDARTARRLLEQLRTRFPRTREAQRAQFMLGRIAMEIEHDPRTAARAFTAYVNESPRGELIEEAYGRATEAFDTAGEGASAQRLARQYLARFPHGDYATLATKLAGP